MQYNPNPTTQQQYKPIRGTRGAQERKHERGTDRFGSEPASALLSARIGRLARRTRPQSPLLLSTATAHTHTQPSSTQRRRLPRPRHGQRAARSRSSLQSLRRAQLLLVGPPSRWRRRRRSRRRWWPRRLLLELQRAGENGASERPCFVCLVGVVVGPRARCRVGLAAGGPAQRLPGAVLA